MLSEPVLVDTGALLAIYNVNDAHHEACKTQSGSLPVGKALTCWPVISEVVYMLRRHVEARDHFLSRVEAQEFVVLPLSASDLRGVRGVYDKYSDQKVDLADACLVHLANRERIRTIFTVDRRHFAVHRRDDGAAFQLIPEAV